MKHDVVKDHITEAASVGQEIDINIPSTAENNQICSILEEFLKKQKGRTVENSLARMSLTESNSKNESLRRGMVKNALLSLGGFL
jgi:hypothetical protein